MQKIILAGIIGLLIGLTIGFVGANRLNKNSIEDLTQDQNNLPGPAPEVQNAAVKEQPAQGSRMPEIAVILEKAKNEPDNFEAQMAAGELYLKIQNFPQAIEFFKIGNRLKPDNYETIVKIGNTLFDAKQFEEAEKWYKQALAIKPEDFAVRTDLGVTFVERTEPDLERAISEFETSLKTNPQHQPTLYNLAVAHYKKGNVEETARLARQIEQIDPESELGQRLKELTK